MDKKISEIEPGPLIKSGKLKEFTLVVKRAIKCLHENGFNADEINEIILWNYLPGYDDGWGMAHNELTNLLGVELYDSILKTAIKKRDIPKKMLLLHTS